MSDKWVSSSLHDLTAFLYECQIINVLGSVGHVNSFSLLFFVYKLKYKNVEAILSLRAVPKKKPHEI